MSYIVYHWLTLNIAVPARPAGRTLCIIGLPWTLQYQPGLQAVHCVSLAYLEHCSTSPACRRYIVYHWLTLTIAVPARPAGRTLCIVGLPWTLQYQPGLQEVHCVTLAYLEHCSISPACRSYIVYCWLTLTVAVPALPAGCTLCIIGLPWTLQYQPGLQVVHCVLLAYLDCCSTSPACRRYIVYHWLTLTVAVPSQPAGSTLCIVGLPWTLQYQTGLQVVHCVLLAYLDRCSTSLACRRYIVYHWLGLSCYCRCLQDIGTPSHVGSCPGSRSLQDRWQAQTHLSHSHSSPDPDLHSRLKTNITSMIAAWKQI